MVSIHIPEGTKRLAAVARTLRVHSPVMDELLDDRMAASFEKPAQRRIVERRGGCCCQHYNRTHHKEEHEMTDIPRRNRLDLNVPAELAIRAAVDLVEALGADPTLTDAVNHLTEAGEHVADFVDGFVDNKSTGDD